ncbi:4-(cytidine 5'-diphospho)-2-C-methyl-D-erythritol kinase [Terricaulis sp.]|uniref:4-(cytidine 5'-diphospho)-2-C-methyl-D-erythritol kinase n=1 Tax=Terricaulis sp. TaxID=2768686 RepID=UPI003783808B
MKVFAPAKINLTLEVGRPRANGLHPLQSLVMFADVGDVVEVEEAETLSLVITGPFARTLPVTDDNLVLRAARALNPMRGAAITLQKNLPVASGIGGGSSDAAAALLALSELWKVEVDLVPIAASLGADVPVCLGGESAFMTGAGECCAPIEVTPLDAVLVNPLKPLPTGDVYRRFDAMALGGDFRESAPPALAEKRLAIAYAKTGNHLWPAALAMMPELGDIATALANEPAALHVGLSGSGATMFALAEDAADASALAGKLAGAHPDWWIKPTCLGRALT